MTYGEARLAAVDYGRHLRACAIELPAGFPEPMPIIDIPDVLDAACEARVVLDSSTFARQVRAGMQ
jgi:hypothetical protein